MLPIIWRYLVGSFLKLTAFSVVAFIVVLLTMRFEELARFIALNASPHMVAFFLLFQTLYMLPISIPISCVIGTVLLMQKLSKSHEIKAMRALGMSLPHVLTPLLLSACLLSVVNFIAASELSTTAGLHMNFMKNQLKEINPFLLLSSQKMMKSKGFYFEAMGTIAFAEGADNVIFALPNRKSDQIQLLVADQLATKDSKLVGSHVTLISRFAPEDVLFDHSKEVVIDPSQLTSFFAKSAWAIQPDHLNTRQLLTSLFRNDFSKGTILSEFFRRISIALAPITFTLLGASCGISISRTQSFAAIGAATLFTALSLATYFMAKNFAETPWIAGAFYFVPHLLICSFSLFSLRQISRGIE